ncbi:uncharacterized protein C8R40DRAFT_1168632 [Lentinula edodes]|uniref:uncharacterized protein n=1 Tax=Lentinula edodes TaxID=5353 RepID=UPI001E8E6594|nr:uncharacterized protein C8R40DRAFT_1168632 [Lentinula edodes]KAH7877290.1 hypothetical protein C8R40DRAFT_1168632 [Lentinula edodes]
MDHKYRVYSPSFEDMDEIVPSSQETEIELTAAELSKFIQNQKAAIESDPEICPERITVFEETDSDKTLVDIHINSDGIICALCSKPVVLWDDRRKVALYATPTMYTRLVRTLLHPQEVVNRMLFDPSGVNQDIIEKNLCLISRIHGLEGEVRMKDAQLSRLQDGLENLLARSQKH